jgi:hypothetical protein
MAHVVVALANHKLQGMVVAAHALGSHDLGKIQNLGLWVALESGKQLEAVSKQLRIDSISPMARHLGTVGGICRTHWRPSGTAPRGKRSASFPAREVTLQDRRDRFVRNRGNPV